MRRIVVWKNEKFLDTANWASPFCSQGTDHCQSLPIIVHQALSLSATKGRPKPGTTHATSNYLPLSLLYIHSKQYPGEHENRPKQVLTSTTPEGNNCNILEISTKYPSKSNSDSDSLR
ncbi:hypothetical protein HI914_07074 [Erysiphe necator]|nr:hypothetical protein HI914_07074 [Erysiphe necator]